MKKIFKIAFILLFTINVNSQITEIVPLNSLKNENGTYRKDLNNELPFWEGTWIGITNNRKYTFQFEILYQEMKR